MTNSNLLGAGIVSCIYKGIIARSQDSEGEFAIAYGLNPELGRVGFKVRVENFPAHLLPFCKNAKIGILYNFNCGSAEALPFNNQAGDVVSFILNTALSKFPKNRYKDVPFIHDPWLLGECLEEDRRQLGDTDLDDMGVVTNDQLQRLIEAIEEHNTSDEGEEEPF